MRIEVIEQYTQNLSSNPLDELNALFKLFGPCFSRGDDNQRPFDQRRENRSVSRREERRRVKQQNVKAVLRLLDELSHPVRTEHLCRVGRQLPTGHQ